MTKSHTDPKDSLREVLAAPTLPPVVFVSSIDRSRRERTVDLLLDRAASLSGVAKTQIRSIVTKFSAADLKGAGFLKFEQACASYSLFSKVQLVLVTDCDELSADQTDQMLTLLPDIKSPTCLIMASKPLPGNSRLGKCLRQTGVALEFAEVKGAELRRWVNRELNRHGIKEVDGDVVDGLIGIGEGLLDKIAPCIELLGLYVEGGTVTGMDLAKLFVGRVPPSPFLISELIASGAPVKADGLARELTDEGRHPLMLTGLIARSFHNYLKIGALLAAGASQAEIRGRIKLPPWVFQRCLESARRYPTTRSGDIFRALIRDDSKLKNRSIGPDAVLSTLIHQLAPK